MSLTQESTEPRVDVAAQRLREKQAEAYQITDWEDDGSEGIFFSPSTHKYTWQLKDQWMGVFVTYQEASNNKKYHFERVRDQAQQLNS